MQLYRVLLCNMQSIVTAALQQYQYGGPKWFESRER